MIILIVLSIVILTSIVLLSGCRLFCLCLRFRFYRCRREWEKLIENRFGVRMTEYHTFRFIYRSRSRRISFHYSRLFRYLGSNFRRKLSVVRFHHNGRKQRFLYRLVSLLNHFLCCWFYRFGRNIGSCVIYLN